MPTLPGLEPTFIKAEHKEDAEDKDGEDEGDWQLGTVWNDDDANEEDAIMEDEEDANTDRVRNSRKRKAGSVEEKKTDGRVEADTPFRVLLCTGYPTRDFGAAMAYLQSMGPSAVDIELRTFPEAWLSMLLAMYEKQLYSKCGFEIVEAYLDVTLQIHMAVISKDPELVRKAEAVAVAHRVAWEGLEDAMQYNLCLLGHFARMQN